MSIKDELERLLSPSRKREQFSAPESPRGISIKLHDFREEVAARERGLKPGYYLTVHPIFPSDLQDSHLLSKLSFFLLRKLNEEGLLEPSDTRIPIDAKAEMFADPAQGWIFSQTGYMANMQLLAIRADHVDRDDIQRIIVTALR